MFLALNRAVLCCALVACSTEVTGVAVTHARPNHDVAKVSAPEVKRTLVAHGDIADMPGFESRMYLIEYPPGAQAGLHVHTEQSIGYVLEGRFESAFGDGPALVTHAGEAFVELAHLSHRFRNPDPAQPLRFVVAGSFRKEEPAFQPLPGAVHFATSPEPSTAPATAPGPITEVKRTLLAQREIADLPGMESRIYLMEFPPSAQSKLHLHTTQGVGYVLDGSFESAFGDEPVVVKRAGDGFVDVPGKPHHFRNPDPLRPLRFLFAGTFHKDEPLFQLLEQ